MKLPTIVYSSVMVADWTTTIAGPRPGVNAHERNPIVNWLEPHPTAMYAVGASLDVLSILAIRKTIGTNHPKIATAIFYTAAAFRTTVVIHNLRYRSIYYR